MQCVRKMLKILLQQSDAINKIQFINNYFYNSAGGLIMIKSNLIVSIMFLLLSCTFSVGACQNPAPRPSVFSNSGGSCPSGYYSSINSCIPSSGSSYFAFYNAGGSCPSGYYSSGNSCVASSSSSSCHAFFNGGGGCPSGYYSSGNSCVSN